MSSHKYQSITKFLKDPTTKAEINNSNFVPILQVEYGQVTSEIVKNLTEKQTLTFKKTAQDHYISA
ncbi:hypothetical protein PR048_017363 [Dryococelus australis]|uniref:Uncharacterized protein n=1 Tax=Dryococelus australis TaxID=614101 RepID=A0ABQ9H9A9_9NEOP|nr:hypothetical protein PR048_017363 [Dryococelus australis]